MSEYNGLNLKSKKIYFQNVNEYVMIFKGGKYFYEGIGWEWDVSTDI